MVRIRISRRSVAPVVALLLGIALMPALSVPAGAASGCPPGSVRVPPTWTSSDWQEEITAYKGTPTTWCLMDGVHRFLQPVLLPVHSTVVGDDDPSIPGTPKIVGSEAITGWKKWSDTVWRAAVPDMRDPSVTPGLVKQIPCLDGTHHCWYPDDVYLGDNRTVRVWAMADLSSSSAPAYFEDYTARNLYVNRDPATKPVDRAVPLPLSSGGGFGRPLLTVGAGSTVSDFTIEKVGTAMQTAAISATGATLRNLDVRYSHGKGVELNGGTLADSSIHSNGQIGIGATGKDPEILGDQVFQNGWLHCDSECGGMKMESAVGGVVGEEGQGNFFQNNDGPGIWVDISSIDYSVAYNDSDHNTGGGIQIEISYDGSVTHNVVFRNGYPSWQPGQYPGIFINTSGSCTSCPANLTFHGLTVSDNVVGAKPNGSGFTSYPNAAGIEVRQSARGSGPYGAHLAKNVSISGNTIWECPAFTPPPTPWSGVATKDFSVFDASRNNTWDGNSYLVSHRVDGPFRWWGFNHSGQKATRYVGWSTWRSAGNDTHGSFALSSTC